MTAPSEMVDHLIEAAHRLELKYPHSVGGRWGMSDRAQAGLAAAERLAGGGPARVLTEEERAARARRRAALLEQQSEPPT